ncbi:MarR family winged helix-turn-helix transcriptional regulator [Parahaliea mediterranea]|uniref:MarR family winged helix-turn-helix transcriptional regulator n=1 Tax=Parahaliea mediterranea TaxID=651086 RepID=UPI000E2F52B6|nr:MarR family transcriptional regulator [Parahaliea mediterranea]
MDLSQSITYQITRAGNILRKLAMQRVRKVQINLSPEEAVLMNQLWDHGMLAQSQLAEWSVKDPSTVSRQIEQLVSKGYIQRDRDGSDRREVRIALTPLGIDLQSRFSDTRVDKMDDDLANLSPSEVQIVLKALAIIQERAIDELCLGKRQ